MTDQQRALILMTRWFNAYFHRHAVKLNLAQAND